MPGTRDSSRRVTYATSLRRLQNAPGPVTYSAAGTGPPLLVYSQWHRRGGRADYRAG
jgi:hypothetical protein